MVSPHKNKKSIFWPIQLIILMLVACLVAPAMASVEGDILGSELNRMGRSKMTGDQRRATNLLERYQRQKKAAKKPQVAPQSAATAEEQMAGGASNQPARADEPLAYYSKAKIDCAGMQAAGAEKKYLKTTITRVQQQLLALGFSLEKIDGVLGINTKAQIAEFCKIDKAYPQWPQILDGNDFARWSDQEQDKDEIDAAALSGNSREVIALLDRFMKRKNFSPSTLTDDFLIAYTLNSDDFKQLKSLKDVFKLISKLQTEAYASRQDFETALETALKGVADPEKYMQLVQKYVEPQSGTMLSDKSFNDLKVNDTPDYILQAIESLRGLTYPDGKIEEAVEARLNALADKTLKLEPAIIKLAKISPAGAKFTDDSLQKFAETAKDDPLATAILGKLQGMKDVVYQSDKTMATAVKSMLTQVVAQITDSQQAILDSVEEVAGFSLSADSMQEIDNQLSEFAVPEVYLEKIEDMEGVQYPDADLFWMGLKAKVSMAGSNNTLKKKIFAAIEMDGANKVDEALLEKMKARGVPPATLAQIATLQGRKFNDVKALEDAVDALSRQLSDQFEKYRHQIVAQAKKSHNFDPSKNIIWDGASCNCVHNNLAGEIYGFYPYSMAGEKQVIDFSLLTRIGYYGLGFDDKGDIPHAARWTDLDTSFIRQAQTYGTKVDLVIYRNNWNTWNLASTDEKAVALENLAGNIVDLVGLPLTNLFSVVKPYISLGVSTQPIMGDGVTLYFDGYPQDTESVEAFDNFIHLLSDRLRSLQRKMTLNIMFRSSQIGKGIHEYSHMIVQMDTIAGNDKKLDSHFLVLLQEPATNDKKLLRISIEDGSRGKERMKLLRNVIMTLTYDGHNVAQLTDDVIYSKDNFGGIGFWPQALTQGKEAEAANQATAAINKVLYDNYLNTATASAPFVCKYVCPNKWLFRISWGIFFFVTILSVTTRFLSCEWRTYFDKHFIHFVIGVVLPTAILSLALLFCDPGWQEISRGNGGLILLLMTGIGYSIWNYNDKKRKANLP